jgi:hypothetical protein
MRGGHCDGIWDNRAHQHLDHKERSKDVYQKGQEEITLIHRPNKMSRSCHLLTYFYTRTTSSVLDILRTGLPVVPASVSSEYLLPPHRHPLLGCHTDKD